jgi:hypothetical protein
MTTTEIDRSLLHAVIDELPANELETIYKMFSYFIYDYHDRHLTQEEYTAHMQALNDDIWYE